MNDAALTKEWFERARMFLLLGRTWATACGEADLAESFRVAQSVVERVEAGRLRMALVGPFSAGKTSFLNRLIQAGEDIRLPVGLGETTAIPTVVRPDERTALFLWQDDRLVEAPDSARKEFLALRQDNIGPILKMYLETQTELIFLTRMEECWRDVEFLDLPGLSGRDARVDGIARMGVRGSDGVLYVTNLKQGGLTRTDIAFIEEAVGQSVPMVVVPTHLDLVPPSARSVLLKTLRNQVRSLKANVVEIIETGEGGARTTSGTVTRFRHFMSRLDNREALRRNLQVVMQGLARKGVRDRVMQLDLNAQATTDAGQKVFCSALLTEGRSLCGDSDVFLIRSAVPLSSVAGVKPQIKLRFSESAGWLLHATAKMVRTWSLPTSEFGLTTPDSAPKKPFECDTARRHPNRCKAVSPSGNYRIGYSPEQVYGRRKTYVVYPKANGSRQRITTVAVSDRGTLLVGGPSLLKYIGRSSYHADWMDQVSDASFLRDAEKWVACVEKGGEFFLMHGGPERARIPREHECLGPFKSVQNLSTCDSPSWGIAVQKRQGWFIIVNGGVVAGPFAYAASPVFLSSGDRWAARVLVEGGATIAVSERGNLGSCATAGVFDEVSAPMFLADGRVVFAAVRNGLASIEKL
jgi:GTPase SAR1 family protein